MNQFETGGGALTALAKKGGMVWGFPNMEGKLPYLGMRWGTHFYFDQRYVHGASLCSMFQ